MNQTSKNRFPILKRHFGSSARYYLRPEAIYSLNRVLYEFLDTLVIKQPEENNRGAESDGFEAWIVPNLFDQCTRSWHFACVLPYVWGSGEGEVNNELFQEMLWLLTKIACRKNLRAQFQAAEKNLLAGEDYAEAYRRIDASVKTLDSYRNECLDKCTALGMAEWVGPFGMETEQNGYEEFKGCCASFVTDALKIFEDAGKATLVRDFLLIYHGYRTHRNLYLQGILYRYLRENQDVVLDRFEGTVGEDYAKVGGSFISFGDESSTTVNETYNQFELDGVERFGKKHWGDCGIDLGFALMLPFYLRKTIQQQKQSHKATEILVLPIHDVWLGNVGYGGLWGCLLCTFPKDGRKKFVLDLLPKLKPVCEVLSAELTMSALATIASHGIVPPYDLVEHFIRMIIHVQDWEHISVYRHKQLLYCYVRVLDKEEKFTWERREPSQSECCCNGPEKSEHEALTWEGRDIWSRDLMPELSVENESAFRDTVLKFEFPKTATVPRDRGNGDSTHELFEFAVIQRQIEVLRALIPKVRARRAALRSAVSAIMGRNMSHNIGSHVLARYSNEVKNDNQGTDRKLKDPREDFLRYLQRRMDFIAEVATADQSFWSQALSIEGVLGTLNLDKEQAAINGINGGGARKPILLSYITGKEVENKPLTATVEIDATSDGDHRYFACPSGEVGVHALYVILENIIRNSARHNENPPCLITVLVKIEEEEQYPDLWKLTLTDLQTQTSEAKCVHDKINKNLDTQILDKDGAPDPKYWGIREMQVCAQYLRNLPLSDLEGPQSVPPILKAVKNEDHLAYVLYVPRAKLCVMASKSPLISDAQKNILRVQGFDFVSSEDKTDAELADALRGYAYAVIEEGVQGIPQVPTFAKLPNGNIVGENWVKKIDWPVRTLCMSKDRLKELIISLLNQTENIQSQGSVSDGAAFKPMKWLEDKLHSRLMTAYQNRRGYLAGKEVAVKVGWEKSNGINLVKGKFEHTKIDCLKNWEGGVDPLLCWIDHAKAVHFTGSPFLRAACKETVVQSLLSTRKRTISSWIYAEVIRSHSPHHHDLENQRVGNISGNELMAAALAKVVIIDERVQSMAGEKNDEIEYSTLWSCMGIGVPSTEEANLNFPAFDAICSFLKKPAELSKNMPIDFVVLHLTILEKLAQERGCDEQLALSQLISCADLLPACEVVIVTGRGVPAVARHEASKRLSARYLPISALLEYLVSNPSKLAVMRALWSAATSKTTE